MKTLEELTAFFAGTNYMIEEGWLYRLVSNSKGESTYPIANFVAYIVSEEIFDDGADSRRYFVIEGVHSDGYPLAKLKISSMDFPKGSWITRNWGAKCNIEPSPNNREILRHAIQLTAKGIATTITFGHLGFRRLENDKWIYIHGKGAVGSDRVSVELNKRLSCYGFPDISFPENNSFKDLLDEEFIPHNISVPLLGITYLSPLNEFLKMTGNEPKSVLFLLGKPGQSPSSRTKKKRYSSETRQAKDNPKCYEPEYN